MSGPFNDYEKRFLLTEIIKTSRIPLHTIFGLIREENVDPNWTEIFIPPGRNLKSCVSAFQEIVSTVPPPPQLTFGLERPSVPTLKRRFSDTEPASTATRTLQPKPAANGDQSVRRGSPADPNAKKRGRPSKEVLEQRRAEAAARGTPYPPLKAAAGRKSTGSVPTGQMTFSSVEGTASGPGLEVAASDDSPNKKRRGRPTKEEAEAKKMMELASGAIDAQKPPSPKTLEAPPQVVEESHVVENATQEPLTSTSKAPEIPDSIETAQSHTLETQPSPLP